MGKLRLAFSVLVIAAIVGYLGWSVGPGLMRDWRLRGVETVEAPSELSDGRCRVFVFAVNFCSFKLRTAEASIDDTLLFVDFTMGGEGVDIVARQAVNDPHQVTTGLALDQFWNRVATFAGFVGLMLFGLIASIKRIFEPTPEIPARA